MESEFQKWEVVIEMEIEELKKDIGNLGIE